MTEVHQNGTLNCQLCKEVVDPDTHGLTREGGSVVFCPRCGWETPVPAGVVVVGSGDPETGGGGPVPVGDGTTVLDYALHYARMGYPVVPVEPGEKVPHHLLAPNGLRNATTNPTVLRAWFQAFPLCNLAVVVPRGVAVLDFDSRDEATRFLARFPELVGAPRSNSPRGVHIWLSVGDGVELRSKSPHQWPAFEVKRPGKAYVLEAPSETSSGAYAWVNPLVPPRELPRVPLDLLHALRFDRTPSHPGKPTTHRPDLESVLIEFKATATPGNRHNRLLAAAAKLQAAAAPEEFFKRLEEAAVGFGLPPHEIRSVFRWVRDNVQPKTETVLTKSKKSLFYTNRRRVFRS